MRDWVVTEEGVWWSVKLDVRDLGEHLDSTFRGWSATLATRVRLVVARLVLVFALPLDFYGRLRVIRSMFILVLCVVWFRFRMLRRFLAYWPGEVFRVFRLSEHVAAGCSGHGPVHLLVESAAEIGFGLLRWLGGRERGCQS